MSHHLDLHDLAARIGLRTPACGQVRLVAIDGPSAAGKTDLAANLTTIIGPECHVVAMEDHYRGWYDLADSVDRIAAALANLAAGRDATLATWDWDQAVVGPDRSFPSDGTVILEGCGSGSQQIAPYLSFLIWVDAPEPVRHDRAMRRDGDTYRPWWHLWAEQEARLFDAQQTPARADAVVRSG